MGNTTTTLYHQTSPSRAQKILSGAGLEPGCDGYGGGGIYFADSPFATAIKATRHGAILKCGVDLGTVKVISSPGDWSWTISRWLRNYDSVKITQLWSGDEYVVFDSNRVKHVELMNERRSTDMIAKDLGNAGKALLALLGLVIFIRLWPIILLIFLLAWMLGVRRVPC